MQARPVKPDWVICREQVGEQDRAAVEEVRRQRRPMDQVCAGGDHRVGSRRPYQGELESPAGKAEAAVGGGRGNLSNGSRHDQASLHQQDAVESLRIRTDGTGKAGGGLNAAQIQPRS